MNEDVITKQRDMLFDACKKIATNKNCPVWIKTILTSTVINAKNLTSNKESEEIVPIVETVNNIEFKLDDLVKSNITKDDCVYKIEKIGYKIENVQLYDISIVHGNSNNPVGTIIHNVPKTMLVRFKQ